MGSESGLAFMYGTGGCLEDRFKKIPIAAKGILAPLPAAQTPSFAIYRLHAEPVHSK